MANTFCKGPDSKYARLWGDQSLSQVFNAGTVAQRQDYRHKWATYGPIKLNLQKADLNLPPLDTDEKDHVLINVRS